MKPGPRVVVFIALFMIFLNTALAATYYKSSWPTSSGTVIACDGSDTRISCADSGDGDNHFCIYYGQNGCQAFEGEDNYGSAGCLIACESTQITCSDGTSSGQCSSFQPLLCNNGVLEPKASSCGCPAGAVVDGNECVIPPVQKCSDQTPYGQCSSTIPLFCNNGILENKASICGCPFGTTQSGENCIATTAIQTCSDGTPANQCSFSKPLFCNNGVLISLASICGCPAGQIISGNNCVSPATQVCSDGTLFGQCSSSKPLFCDNGVLISKASACGCSTGQVSGDICIADSGNDGDESSGLISFKGMLLIIDVDAKIDGKKVNVKDGRGISRDLHPESSLEFKVEAKNEFNLSDNLKIEDVTVTVTIEGIDNANDLEQESSSFDLRPQQDKAITLRFTVPLNVDEGNYNVDIEAEGEDENGETHTAVFTTEIEVKREVHDLRFLDFNINPQTITCGNSITSNYRILNVGKDDEELAKVAISSQDLGIDFAQGIINIASESQNNIFSGANTIKLKENLQRGTYSVAGGVYSADGGLMDEKTAQVTVSGCQQTIEGDEPVLLLINQPSQQANATSTFVETTTEISLSGFAKTALLAGLGFIIYLLFLIFIVAVIVIALS